VTIAVPCVRDVSNGKEVAATFGIKKSGVSRKFIRASASKLKESLERGFSGYDIVRIFIDGNVKGFAENEIIIALGITLEGEKVILGFIESSTEKVACALIL
jgi:putative transposase